MGTAFRGYCTVHSRLFFIFALGLLFTTALNPNPNKGDDGGGGDHQVGPRPVASGGPDAADVFRLHGAGNAVVWGYARPGARGVRHA